MGWSRSGISTASLLSFLAMGFGSFFWGTISDPGSGSRVVVLCGGVLLGRRSRGGQPSREQCSVSRFCSAWGSASASRLLLCPVDDVDDTLVHAASQPRRGAGLGRIGAGVGGGRTTLALDHRQPRLAIRPPHPGHHRLGGHSSGRVTVARRAARGAERVRGPSGGAVASDMTVAQALRTPQFAAIAMAFFMCCAAHSGPIFHMVSYAVDCGVPDMAAATVFGVAGLSAMGGRIICGLIADRAGAKRTLVAGLTLQAVAVSLYLFTSSLASFYAVAALFGFSYGGVMLLYAILVREYFPARHHGFRLRCRRDDIHTGHGDRAAGRRLVVRYVRQLCLAVCRVDGARARGGSDRPHHAAADFGADDRDETEPGMIAVAAPCDQPGWD